MSVNIKALQQAKRAIRSKLEQYAKVSQKTVTVGIHSDAGEHHDSGMTNAQLGALLNYGNPNNKLYGNPAPIPPRPWLIPGVQSGKQDIVDTIAHGIANDLPLDQVLEQVGAFAAGAVQQYMVDLRTPPNTAYTIEQKGSDNPLVDTGALVQSVTYKVINEKPDEGIL